MAGCSTCNRASQKLAAAFIALRAQPADEVFGADGSAALLGMKPTTLASRIKVLGISR